MQRVLMVALSAAMVAVSGHAMAGGLSPGVPEMGATGAIAAVAAVGGVVALIKERRNRRK